MSLPVNHSTTEFTKPAGCFPIGVAVDSSDEGVKAERYEKIFLVFDLLEMRLPV